MNKKQAKRQRDLKNKLMAAICMLLVSSIMMVSTTYAWFTLSTAPEVTGINTAVGANGNLEMALLPENADLTTIGSNVGDSFDSQNKTVDETNRTWGNLVKLDEGYGLSEITLYPAELNLDGNTIKDDGFLKTPVYGSDGRVSAVNANTSTAAYNGTGFYPATDETYGVRAIGTMSGMTDRELSFRSARATAKTKTTNAQNAAKAALIDNGSTLANIALQFANAGENATFNKDDVAALQAMVDDLETSLQNIDAAYKNYILAYAASSMNSQSVEGSDEKWRGVQLLVSSSSNDLADVIAGLNQYGVNVPDPLNAAIAHYYEIVEHVEDADGVLTTLAAQTSVAWDPAGDTVGMRDALALLANPEAMLINGHSTSEVKANMGTIMNDVIAGRGITVTISTGGGAYVDIAEHVGNYSAKVTVKDIEISGYQLESMDATMVTSGSQGDAGHLGAYHTALNGKEPSSGEGGEAMPLSDMYGYIVDLAFRTNAAASDLLLQVAPADRIYTDNNNDDTMGHGSNMTFTAADNNFTTTQMTNLMEAIRIVFFDPTNRTIIANAELDTANATVTTNSVTADIRMAESTVSYFAFNGANYYGTDADAVVDEAAGTSTVVYTFTDEAGNAKMKATVVTTTTTVDGEETSTSTTTYTGPEGTALTKEGGEAYTEQDYMALAVSYVAVNSGEKIMALTQNTATPVSVLVYLDGTAVENADVAYSSATSMTGTMNLQFASSANLVPMDYADLHTTGDGAATTYTVTVDGTAESTGATAGVAYNYTPATGKTVSTVKVGDATLTSGTDYTVDDTTGKITIPAAKVTGNIVITTADKT